MSNGIFSSEREGSAAALTSPRDPLPFREGEPLAGKR